MSPPSFVPPSPILTFRTIPSAPLPPSYSSPHTPPSYSEEPSTTPAPPPPTYTETDISSSTKSTHYLLAQIQENMTLTKPTLILKDLAGTSFAIVWNDLNRDSLDFKKLGLKKNNCLLLPNALRTEPREEGRQAMIKIYGNGGWNDEQVKVIPGTLEKVVEVGQFWDQLGDESKCANCEKETKSEGLKKCTGCGRVGYCSKECQVEGWTNGGHKSLCKVIKRFTEIWP
ncbi:hypothetical protein QBC38DRAFT_471924 [Podospora fimiseda]|uniref:MYND-type domain-containing protein n=1 Tax=Podospora fimiseda TaxID=252190 RepID=A0AAN7BUG2_9PEZI|nr:hypothetical protein QBC38DRAFT_471924 [Podospora fimiseda]